ncbi:MAG TPA: metallophosphoesterase [Xanthobacteraceae bacterium]|nr:metallophosphoesterase [Xanthobacteraceae bacterium]
MSFVLGQSRKRLAGGVMIALGALAIYAPMATGEWSLALLGIPLLALSVAEARATFASPRRGEVSAYLPSLLAMLAGIVIFHSPKLVLSGLLILLAASLAIDGASKIVTAVRSRPPARVALLINGVIDVAVVLLMWLLRDVFGTAQAVGIAIGIYVAAAGWRMLVSPDLTAAEAAGAASESTHPDTKLGLPPSDLLAQSVAMGRWRDIRGTDIELLLTLVAVFFAIHLGRMQTAESWLGIVSPFVATAGDVLMSIAVAALLVLPLRLLWRRLTRPVERLAWSLRVAAADRSAPMNPAVAWLNGHWLDWRLRFSVGLREARTSLPAALLVLLRLGMPVTAFFVAINPIWGFTWYFNTESWASGIYQKLTELRVDRWRAAMVDAVARAYGGDPDDLFRIRPAGVEGSGDFSFLVIGDPGEGDPSQYSLISRYLELGRRDDVKFLVVASDVVYPAGAMSDYEFNFYLPLKGVTKPVYGIPGNHDWFDALEGFNANFLEPRAARAAMAARVEADLHLTSTDSKRIDKLIEQAARLRRLYGVEVGTQRAPFFELQTDHFALLAIDTGILRSVDERQWAWLERALTRSRGKFIMAIVGHPRFAGGRDVSLGDKEFSALYRLLRGAGVAVAMAGDTHDFEYYGERVEDGGAERVLHHFVNGGGGAYLSIGTALDFPASPSVADSAFYPSTAALRAKLEAETPLWKKPIWYWIKWLDAWPFAIESLSGVFDFNYAPFFQSFMEVRVERSRNRVVFALHGIDGPLRWRDLDMRGAVVPEGVTPDGPVEFVVPSQGK